MRTPQLSEVIEAGALTVFAERGQSMPARVITYDRLTQRAQVQPAISIARGDLDGDGLIDFTELPVVDDVPVIWPRGGGFSLHLPLGPGDWVLLIIASRSLDDWMARGETGVEPADLRLGALQDAIAIPGMFPNPEPLSADAARAGEAVLSTSSGNAQVRLSAAGVATITAPEVRLGGPSATLYVALGAPVVSNLSDIAVALAEISVQLIALGQTGVVPPYTPSAVSATKTKAE